MHNLNLEEKAIIKSHAFAQILSSQVNDSGFAELSYCPLQLLEKNSLLGHLSNNNPLLKRINKNPVVKAVFTGPHGYISPRWHNEQVVPTWNYATVSLTCRMKFIENSNEKLKAMERISHHFDPQWDFSEFNNMRNSKMVQQMLSAITIFTLEVIDAKSKFKLSQNRSVECRSAFQNNLRLTGYNDLANIQLL
jgi:transcriptional regulator